MITKEQLKQSVEYKYNGFNFLITFLISSIWTIFFVSLNLIVKEAIFLITLLSITVLPLIPLMIYYSYRKYQILKDQKNYKLLEVKFETMEASLFGMRYFRVPVEINNRKIILDTRAIFTPSLISNRRIELFLNKDVFVALNEETQTLVVLGLVNK